MREKQRKRRWRATNDTCYDYKLSCGGEKRIHGHSTSLGKKNEIEDYFHRISWTSYKFEWLEIFFFFLNGLFVEYFIHLLLFDLIMLLFGLNLMLLLSLLFKIIIFIVPKFLGFSN